MNRIAKDFKLKFLRQYAHKQLVPETVSTAYGLNLKITLHGPTIPN